MSDEHLRRLLGRIGNKDETAFQELYHDRAASVFAYALRQLRDPGRAEEVVVDTLYDVWRKADSFRGDSSVNTWIIGIARNHLLMVLRTRSRREHPGSTEDIEPLANTLVDGAPSPLARFAISERRAKVDACLDELPLEQRESIHLVFFEGFSIDEVAQSTQSPNGTVKSRLFHARRKLRDCLSKVLGREDLSIDASEFAGGTGG